MTLFINLQALASAILVYLYVSDPKTTLLCFFGILIIGLTLHWQMFHLKNKMFQQGFNKAVEINATFNIEKH